MLWVLSPGWGWVYQGTWATVAPSRASCRPSSAVWRCLVWKAAQKLPSGLLHVRRKPPARETGPSPMGDAGGGVTHPSPTRPRMLWLLPWFWESRAGFERRELLRWVPVLLLQPRGANSEEKALSSPEEADG